jgi:hypothetical protein
MLGPPTPRCGRQTFELVISEAPHGSLCQHETFVRVVEKGSFVAAANEGDMTATMIGNW